jgi:hypothetical protein
MVATDIASLKASELDAFLQKEYEISLHQFALAVCDVLHSDFYYKGKPTYSELIEKKSDYRHLLRIMKRLYGPEFITKSGFYADFKLLELEIGKKSKKRGRHIDLRSAIISLWGSLFSQKNRKIEWTIVRELYDWFWHRFCSYEFYGVLEPSVDPDNLKKQYYRNKGKFKFDFSHYGRCGIIIFGKTFVSIDVEYQLFNILMDKWSEEKNRDEIKRLSEIRMGNVAPSNWKDKRDAYYLRVAEIYARYIWSESSNLAAVPLIVFPDGTYYLELAKTP